MIIEFIHGTQKPHVSFLDEIQEMETAAEIFFRNRHDEPQIRIRELLSRPLASPFLRFRGPVRRARFHVLGQTDFFLRRKERYASDFLEVHSHRIVGGNIFVLMDDKGRHRRFGRDFFHRRFCFFCFSYFFR